MNGDIKYLEFKTPQLKVVEHIAQAILTKTYSFEDSEIGKKILLAKEEENTTLLVFIKNLISENIVPESIEKLYDVSGMSCSSCASTIEDILKNTAGVLETFVNFSSNTLRVEFIPTVISGIELEHKVLNGGFEIKERNFEKQGDDLKIAPPFYQTLEFRILLLALLTIPVFIYSMFFEQDERGKWVSFILTSFVLIIGGARFYRKSFALLKQGKANMDTQIAVSITVAFLFSVWNLFYPHFLLQRGFHPSLFFEAVSVTVFMVYLGKYLESKSKVQSGSAISGLLSSDNPYYLRKNLKGEWEETVVKDIEVDDIILVKPNMKIPVDGVISTGEGYIDEVMLTGESFPVSKGVGQEVYSGTFNQTTVLEVLVKRTGAETYLSSIVKLVEQSQNSRTEIQNYTDKVSSWFVPLILFISVVTFLIWYLLNPANLLIGIVAFISVLVIACPCALGLATPMAVTVGIGRAADEGILIKNADTLEKLNSADVVVFDKTGTLTEGRLKLEHFFHITKNQDEKIKSILKSFAMLGKHPVLNAIQSYVSNVTPAQFSNYNGNEIGGSYAEVDGIKYYFGSIKYLKEKGFRIEEREQKEIDIFLNEGKNVVGLVENNLFVFYSVMSDVIRSSTLKSVRKLQESGKEILILSGDNEVATSRIAAILGVSNYRSMVLPEQKLEIIEELQQRGKTVVMVGDGVNDGPALAKADVSMAVRQGSDLALQVADITLFHSGIDQVVRAFSLARQTMKTVKLNLFFAFIYNILMIPLAAGLFYPYLKVMLPPMLASTMMAFSSFSVIGNSLYLKKIKL